MNLLEIVQQACYELGIVPPTFLVGNTDPQALQLYGLSNREVKEQQQNRDWTGLQEEYVIFVGQPTTLVGNTTNLSPVITNLPDTTGITANEWVVQGENIPVAARVLSVDSLTQVTLSEQASATQTGVSLLFAKDTYPVPCDFDRYNNRTMWDRTNRWELIGPDTPQFDQWHRSGIVTVGPRRHFRQIGTLPNVFRIWPPPAIGDTPINLVFEYLSLNCVMGVDGTKKQKFTADTDVPLMDEQSIILGIKWRFLQAKGFSYAAQQDEYNAYVSRRQGADGGAQTLNLGRPAAPSLISPANVQDGFFPGPGAAD